MLLWKIVSWNWESEYETHIPCIIKEIIKTRQNNTSNSVMPTTIRSQRIRFPLTSLANHELYNDNAFLTMVR